MGLTNLLQNVLAAWALTGPDISVSPIETGHINTSFKVKTGQTAFFLQKLNQEIFPDPDIIASNLEAMGKIAFHGQVSSLPPFLLTSENTPYFVDSEGDRWRVFPWIASFAPKEEESSREKAYRTAQAFGTWTSTVNHAIDLNTISPAIAGFHQLPEIYSRFTEAWNRSAGSRKHLAAETTSRLSEGNFVLKLYQKLVDFLPVRIIHGDAKADNILIGTEKSWIIDLDTVMPGYLWMDVGDMVRSMACSLPESSDQLDQIRIEPDVVEKILEGYGQGIGDLISPLEIESLRLGPCCIIYEQVIRFLTDFLEGDTYYPVSYPEENLVRAQNQLLLWESYWEYLEHRTGLSSL